MRRPGVRIPSRPPSFKTTSSVPNSSYRGTLGLSSLPDSFRYLVIHPERHCLSAASSVNTSRLPVTNPANLPEAVSGFPRLRTTRPVNECNRDFSPIWAALLSSRGINLLGDSHARLCRTFHEKESGCVFPCKMNASLDGRNMRKKCRHLTRREIGICSL